MDDQKLAQLLLQFCKGPVARRICAPYREQAVEHLGELFLQLRSLRPAEVRTPEQWVSYFGGRRLRNCMERKRRLSDRELTGHPMEAIPTPGRPREDDELAQRLALVPAPQKEALDAKLNREVEALARARGVSRQCIYSRANQGLKRLRTFYGVGRTRHEN